MAGMPTAADLGKRREPVQQRAIQARSHILQTARTLLEEVGLDAFNTNLLADRADVRVRTVYRYFPNKLAVIAAIGEELVGKWTDWNLAYFEAIAQPDRDWREALSQMIAEWFSNVSNENGGWAVLQAMSVVPELRELDRAAFQRLSRTWEVTILSRVPNLKADVVALSFAIVSTFYGFIDSFMRVPADLRPQFAQELEVMLVARLTPVFAAQEAG
jgi:AcrR family transcriptional regulator